MIRITRVKRLIDLLVEYPIYIDGVYRGSIGEGDTMDFEVENGCHNVYAKFAGWYSSKELCVDVNDSIVELELKCTLRWWELFSPLKSRSYRAFRKDELLTLKVKGENEEEKI